MLVFVFIFIEYFNFILIYFSYELGSGPAEITTNFTVNDSLPHTIQAIRYLFLINSLVLLHVLMCQEI